MKRYWIPESCIYDSASECLDKASSDAATMMVSGAAYAALLEHAALVAGELESIIDNLEHYFENSCCPTKDELEQTRRTFASWQAFLKGLE